MTSNTVAGLYAKLDIAQSHSRPHVSDDNPYSESAFKTLKYCPAFPGEFGSIQDANVFCETFFTYYKPSTGTPASRCTPPHPSTTATGRPSSPLGRHPPRRLPCAPERFRGHCPQPKEPARQGMDQRATCHHRDRPVTTNHTSSLMSHLVDRFRSVHRG
jgi:putative transposase